MIKAKTLKGKINKIVFVGTPQFAVPTLEFLSVSKYKPELVITQPDRKRGRGRKLQPTPIKKVALKNEIEVIQPKDINDEETYKKLKEINPELIIVVAYGGFIKKRLRKLPKFGCINLHPSLLPEYRGAAPMNYSLFNCDKYTGISIFRLVAKMDAGPIIFQKKIELKQYINYSELSDFLSKKGAKYIVRTLSTIEEEGIKEIIQDEDKVSFSHKFSKKDMEINWEDSAEKIKGKVMGLAEKPGAFTTLRDKKIKIIDLEILANSSDKQNGEIVGIPNKEGFFVSTSTTNILVKKVQPAGKKPMKAYDFNLGAQISIGEKFE